MAKSCRGDNLTGSKAHLHMAGSCGTLTLVSKKTTWEFGIAGKSGIICNEATKYGTMTCQNKVG